ncbi:MAG: hypothetical protein JNM13_15575 [Hyphomicrobiaceae bacterium]|nr:hypothetical protein [Hyphomicrobiaceae bacterium]
MTHPVTAADVGLHVYMDVTTLASGIYMRLSPQMSFDDVAREYRALAARLEGHIATLERGLRRPS